MESALFVQVPFFLYFSDMKKRVFLLFALFVFVKVYAQNERPNIILFLVDDMGWQDCSLPFWDKPTKLNATYHTPNMEKLAAKGMMFTNAYSNAVCTPTRVSLMTGMNVARHGVTNWTNVNSNTPTDFKDSVLKPANWNYNGLTPERYSSENLNHTVVATPLPQILKAAGYYTIHAGKAHFAPTGLPGASPINMGFDINIGGSAAGHPGSFLASKNYRQNEKDTSWAVRGLEKYIPEDLYLTEAITRETIHTLDARDSNKPFFLYLSHYAVHVPYEKDVRFYQKYMDAGLTDTEAKYAALVEGMDKSLGDIMHYLEKNGLDKKTYILFTSDNGGLSLKGSRSGEPHTQNLPLKQGKGSLYEGGIRVPMIAAGPQIKSGSVSKQYIVSEDYFTTILQMASIQNPTVRQIVDGKSFLPVLQGKQKTIDQKKTIVWHYPNNWTNINLKGISWASAIRQGDWKLIYFHKQQTIELFNLSNDIEEQHNLSGIEVEKTKALANLLTQKLKERNAAMPSWLTNGKTIAWPNEIPLLSNTYKVIK
jgi:arylsulfatase A-like enzyme